MPKGKAAVAAAIARAKAKKAAQANADGTDTNGAETDNAVTMDANDSISATDTIAQEAPLSQKDKVAAAIARAKAKKRLSKPILHRLNLLKPLITHQHSALTMIKRRK
ncbi:hypothetical protein LFREDSHE_22430 [Shewanella baltica]